MNRFELIDTIEMMELGLLAAADPKFAEQLVEEFLASEKARKGEASNTSAENKVGVAA